MFSFEAIISLIRQRLFSLMPGAAKPLQPKNIIKKALSEARRNKLSWNDDRKAEIPNLFLVSISHQDWEDYYKVNNRPVSEKIAQIIEDEVKKSPDMMIINPAIVSIQPKDHLQQGELEIDMAFYVANRNASPNAEDVVASCDNPAAAVNPSPELYSSQTVPFVPAKHAARTMDFIPDQPRTNEASPSVDENIFESATVSLPCSLTPFLDEESIPTVLLSCADKTWTISSDEIIGVDRNRADSPRPSVCLDGSTFKYVSQSQGRLTYVNGAWCFVHLGKHATTISYPDGSTVCLESVGQDAPLYDQAVISFAKSPSLTFELAA